MQKRLLRYFLFIIVGYVIICLATPYNKALRNRAIKNQIHYLSELIGHGYDDKLQRQFPEGKLFSNALLALATIEYSDKNKIVNQSYAQIVDYCIIRMLSEKAKSIFSPDLTPSYGMFYNGWTNYVLQSYSKSRLFDLSKIQEQVKENSEIIEQRLVFTQSDSLRILETYTEANWPADNLIGIISLQDDSLRKQWIDKVLETARHPSGLIHHAGSDPGLIRGSSSAMITFCLSEIAYSDMDNYSQNYSDIFIDDYLGLLLVKENEDGSSQMDVDSGPVVFGYGASATVMNIKTQASRGNPKAKSTFAAMNLLGLPIHLFNKKYYLLKKEPMYDLFMLWGLVEL